MHHRRLRTPVAVIAAIAAIAAGALAGCGDDTSDGSAATVETVAEADAATAEIVIEGFAFSGPGTIEVGTTVVVRNDDSAQHTWTSVDDVFDSGALGADDSFSFTFDEVGEYAYFCEFHPSMSGTIVVTG